LRVGAGCTGGVQEALEFGGEAEAGEFVGHPDVGFAVAEVFDAGAEVAGGEDVTGGCADDAGEEIVDFLEVQGDGFGPGFLDRFDAGDDAFPAEETASAGGSCTAIFCAVDVGVGLSGASTGSDFAGNGFVAGGG
jgi:hypothetical protein